MILRKLSTGILALLVIALVLPVPAMAAGNATDDLATVNEDAPATTIDVLGNDLGTPTVTLVGTALNGTATLDAGAVTYTPDPDFYGEDTFQYTIDTADTATVTVTVDPVNDAPAFTAGANPSVDEDAGAQTVAGWATGMSVGPANESGQTLTFTAVAGDPTLFSAGPDVDEASGDLTFTPAANAFGSTVVNVTLTDTGGTAGADVNSVTHPVTVTIDAVNDAPSFTEGADQNIAEDAGTQTVAGWATLIDKGAANENGQTLTFQLTAANTALFATQPAIAAGSGNLTYTPAANANGSTTVDVVLTDDGGTANGGIDSSATETLTITISAANDNPTAVDDTATVAEDSTANTVNVLANDDDAPDTGETLTVTGVGTAAHGSTAFTAGGVTYTPDADYAGGDSFTYTISDGNSGTDTATVTVTVSNLNDVPTAMDDPLTVLEDASATTVNVLGNDLIEPDTGETLTVTAVGTATHGSAVLDAGTVTYAPDPNYNGADSFTYTISDGNGGTDTASVNITVTAVNDAPSFTKGADQTDLEDPGLQTVAGWATAISKGPANEAGQVLTFNVTGNTNPGLFSAGPAVAADGTLTYTPAANANGSATVTVTLSDNGGTLNGGLDTSAAQAFTITVTAVNDVPSFTKGANQTVLEDSGAQSVPTWASAISKGPADESGQVLTFTVTNDNNALFSVQPAVAANGTLTYTPALNANGSATITVSVSDNGGTLNGGVDTSVTQTFTITVTAVNDAPSFTKGADQTDPEDAGAQIVAGWATAISRGPADESAQSLTFAVTNDNNDLFSVQPAVAANGTLTYTPAPGANGSASVSVKIQDNGGTANGGVNESAAQPFTISVGAVNDAPSFTKGADQADLEDAGAQTVAGWATDILAGPPDESAQVLTFTVTNDNNALFSAQPAVAANGTLTYTPAANANGSATVTVTLSDDGGGNDTSAAQTFDITVTAVNDAPSFTKGADQTDLEDPGLQTVAGWATAISKGPANEAGQVLTFNVTGNTNPGLFSAGPAVAADGTLTYTPAANANGSATVTVTLSDNGGTLNGGLDTSAAQAFTITVTAVNDVPSFTKGANQTVLEDSGAQTAAGWATTISKGPADESGQVLTFSVTATDTSLFAVQPDVDEATGTLTFTPAANAAGTTSVSVHLSDSGASPNQSATQTFSITITDVNDAPTFTKGADQTDLEDPGPQSVVGWATGISKGPASESAQVLTFSVTGNTNPGLFSAGPAVAAGGTLAYTLTAHANGSATITVRLADNGGTANGGVDTSAAQTFTITVTPVNDAPSFTKGADRSHDEGAGAQTVPGWATDILAGPPDESGQSVSFAVTGNTNPGLFSVAPAVAVDGTLTYTIAPSVSGLASISVVLSDTGGTANGGANESAPQVFTISVGAVNDRPTFTAGIDPTVLEDAGAQTVAGWATDILAGPADEVGQALTFAATNDNNGLFSVQPSVAANGTLTYTPAANANGSATVTVTLSDNGGTANGGLDTSAAQTFTITVTEVNDVPSFTKGADQTDLEDAGAQTVATWATAISRGPANESSQALTFNVTGNTNPGLFSAGPAVAANGTLTYTPAANANGSATITVTVSDDGGTANGGLDTSAAQTFTITVTAVNDVPSFTKGADHAVDEDAGAQTVAGWATGMSEGPADEVGQVLAFSVTGTTNDLLFGAGPAVDPATGDLTYTPAADANGSATVTLALSDGGGTADGGVDTSAAQTFTITVTAVNDAPSFTDLGDQAATRNEGANTVQTFVDWASAISAGPPDESAQVLTFVVTDNTNAALFAQAPAVDGAGTLTFVPAYQTSGTADVTVELRDDVGGVSAPHTFTITVSGVNQAPVAGNDPVTVRLAGPTVVDVLADDSAGLGEPGDTLRVTGAYGATRGYVTIAADGSSLTYDPIGCSTGTDTFTYVVTDGGGLTDTAIVAVKLSSPTAYPVADGPRPSLVSGTTIGSTVSVKFSWCGLTSGTTIKSYGLARSVNGGSYSTVISSTSATSATRSLSFGPRYQYRAKVTDKKGRVAFGYGPTVTVTRTQENSTSIAYAGTWRTKSTSKASGGRMTYASSTSASATFTVSGTRQLGIVGPKGTGYGSVKVYVNGSYVGSFSERARSSSYRKLLYVRTLDPGRSYTIKLKPAGNGRIYLDAVLALK